MKFGKQNNYKTYLYSRPTIVVLLIVIVFLAMSVHERFVVERDMAYRKNVAEEDLTLIKERQIQIQKRVEYLEGERGIEEEIRKNFDVIKEGEQVIILTGEDPEPVEEVEEDIVEYPWYQFWR